MSTAKAHTLAIPLAEVKEVRVSPIIKHSRFTIFLQLPLTLQIPPAGAGGWLRYSLHESLESSFLSLIDYVSRARPRSIVNQASGRGPQLTAAQLPGVSVPL